MSGGIARGSNRRTPVAFLGALVLAITVSLGAASAIADTPPSVTINPPTEVAYTTTHVSGTVDPEGGPSTTVWYFETSTDPSDPSKWVPQYSAYGEISGAEAEASDPVAVGGTLYYLQPGVTYSVRLVAENQASANRSETQSPYPSFTTIAVPPPTVTIAAPTEVTTNSASLAGAINPGGSDPAFGVQWHFQCTPACPGTSSEQYLPASTSPEPVSVAVKGLQPNTTYAVRLIATNPAGKTEAGPESFSTAAEAPSATTIGATVPAGGTSATVGGRINPRNSATTYWIEYGTTNGYGQNAPSTKDASAGAGGQTIAVSQQLGGLTPETTYHYRLVAKNAVGTILGQDLTFETPSAGGPPPPPSCTNQALRVGPSAALPSCRAYEQLSPQDKNESNADGGFFTADGEHVRYSGTGAFAGARRGGPSTYLATRTQDGWQSRSLTPPLPQSVPQSSVPPSITVNGDGSLALLQTADPLVAADTNGNTGTDDYLQSADGTLDWISKPTATFGPPLYPAFYPGLSTTDLSHVIFQTTTKSVAASAPLVEASGSYGVYEWVNGTLSLVNVDSGGAVLNPYGAGLGESVGGRKEHALSADGERIYFTTPEDIYNNAPPPFEVNRLYLRESGQTTTEISATQCDEPSCAGPAQDATYQGASVDGSVAFFTSSAQLTDDATPGGGLYRYDVGSGKLTLLTPDSTDPGGAGVEGLVRNSDDGSLVYFVATGKLVAGATLGSDNLYLYDATTEATTFIATLNASDDGVWAGFESSAEVTPSGQGLLFRTAAPLAAGYDNAGHFEIYRYDASSRSLACLSCLPIGSPAQSDASFGEATTLHNNLSDDGSRAFFQTATPLVSRDTNGQVDVYEWHDGVVSLISSGTSNAPSQFSGASASGNDVLFSTWQPLASTDDDEHIDVYDARVDGGIASDVTPSPTPCSGEGCRGSATGPGAGASPASANFDGAEGGSPDRAGAFGLSAVSSSQAKKWAKTGLLSLRVKVPAAGRVKATASARLGKRSSTVASAAASAKKAGTVSLALRLSKAARSYLDKNGRLPVTIAVTYSKSKAAKRVQVTLAAQSKQADRGQR